MNPSTLTLSEWFSLHGPAHLWRGYSSAYRAGAFARMVELSLLDCPYHLQPFASLWAGGFFAMDSYLASGATVACPACSRAWAPPPRPLPQGLLSLKSFLDRAPMPDNRILTTAFRAGVASRYGLANRFSCPYEHTWQNRALALRLAELWRSGYDLLDRFLDAGGTLHCPCCWRPWVPEPGASIRASLFQYPITKLLDEVSA